MKITGKNVTDEQIRELYVAVRSCPVNGDIGHLHSGPSYAYARTPCACGRQFPHPGHRTADDELDRNALIQLAQRALSGEQYARDRIAAAIHARNEVKP